MSAHTQSWQQANLLTGRQMVLAATIALHALVIGALMTAHFVPRPEPIAIPTWIDTYTPPDEPVVQPPQEIPVDIKVPPVIVSIPIPDVPVDVPVVDIPDSTALQSQPAPAEVGPVVAPAPDVGVAGPVAEPVIATTALQYRAVRPADDYYPDASLKLQEAGTAIVQVCVAPTGRIEGAPTIQQSSGSPRLDAAALRWAREALRFTPATRGGVPVSACKGFRVNFRLR